MGLLQTVLKLFKAVKPTSFQLLMYKELGLKAAMFEIKAKLHPKRHWAQKYELRCKSKNLRLQQTMYAFTHKIKHPYKPQYDHVRVMADSLLADDIEQSFIIIQRADGLFHIGHKYKNSYSSYSPIAQKEGLLNSLSNLIDGFEPHFNDIRWKHGEERVVPRAPAVEKLIPLR